MTSRSRSVRPTRVCRTNAVLTHESVNIPSGIAVVAGPWARTSTPTINPSYLAPQAFKTLRRITGDHRWDLVSESACRIVIELTTYKLPPDWAHLDANGHAMPSAAPDGSPAQYGPDAARLPILWATAPDEGERHLAGRMWSMLERLPAGLGALPTTLDGSRTNLPETDTQPLALLAASFAATAAIDHASASRLLASARDLDDHRHTYYSDAWLALSGVLTDLSQ